jgi:myo-inositol-1-phosphate synthase
VPILQDRKAAPIRLEAEAFGGTTFELELKLSVEDSPSVAGYALDAVRHAKFALERGALAV